MSTTDVACVPEPKGPTTPRPTPRRPRGNRSMWTQRRRVTRAHKATRATRMKMTPRCSNSLGHGPRPRPMPPRAIASRASLTWAAWAGRPTQRRSRLWRTRSWPTPMPPRAIASRASLAWAAWAGRPTQTRSRLWRTRSWPRPMPPRAIASKERCAHRPRTPDGRDGKRAGQG